MRNTNYFDASEKGKKTPSHICGLWMLITATFRCVKEGPMAGASWERPSQPRLGAHWGSSGTAHTRKYMLLKEVPFFIKILHLSSPDQDLSLMGCRGYLTKSAVLCCRSSLTGDFCKYSQWAERLYGFYCVRWVNSVGDKTQTLLLKFFLTKNIISEFFLTKLCELKGTYKKIFGICQREMDCCNGWQKNGSFHCP